MYTKFETFCTWNNVSMSILKIYWIYFVYEHAVFLIDQSDKIWECVRIAKLDVLVDLADENVVKLKKKPT